MSQKYIIPNDTCTKLRMSLVTGSTHAPVAREIDGNRDVPRFPSSWKILKFEKWLMSLLLKKKTHA